jgi:hypothetical protein
VDGHYSDHYKANKPNSETKCQQRMLLKLLELKKQERLRKAFLLESNEFEVLEFYGDAYLYERVTKNILRSRRFMDPNLMTTLRRYCIKNDNLAAVFDQLGLGALLESSESLSLLTRKNKADIVEAIIGEIAEDHPEEDVLSELIAFISYIGEKEYFKEHNNHVMEPKNSSRNSKRIPRSDPHPRSYNDYTPNHSPNNQKDYNSSTTTSNTASLPQSPPKDPAPVFFLQKTKPKTSPPPPIMDNIKILKRGTDEKAMNPSSPAPRITHNNSDSLSESAPTVPSIKSNQLDNFFFKFNGQTPSQSPWVPNIASTRNGMDLKT